MDDPVGPGEDPVDPERNRADATQVPEDADFPERPTVNAIPFNSDGVLFFSDRNGGEWIELKKSDTIPAIP